MTDHLRPWIIRSARTIYENPWIHVREYQTEAPTGAPALYGLVHMKRLALGVLPIDEQGRTILVGQQRFPFGRYSWELPEGGGDPGASPLEGARRELAEETGQAARDWTELFREVQLSNSVTDERAWAYIAWNLHPAGDAARDDCENIAVRTVPFSEAVAMAVEGEILDAFSLVMILKADHLMRTGGLPPQLCERMMRS